MSAPNHLRRGAAWALLLLAPAAASAQAPPGAPQGAPGANVPSVLPSHVKVQENSSGGDPVGRSFVIVDQIGKFNAGDPSACQMADSEVGGGPGDVQLKFQHYRLNTLVGKTTWDNLLQYAHPRTTIANPFAEMKSEGLVTVKPPRRTQFEGGEAMLVETIDRNNCNVEKNFVTYTAIEHSYYVKDGTVIDLTISAIAGAPPVAVVERTRREIIEKIKLLDWSRY